MSTASPAGFAVWLMVLLPGCGSADGVIFEAQSTDLDATPAGSSASAGSASVDSGTVECEPSTARFFEGNDPSFTHLCGEECDSDWCACDPCLTLQGELGRVDEGAHVLRIQGGASGAADFRLMLSLETGVVVFDEQIRRDGLFEDSFPFSTPACQGLSVSWTQMSEVCTRVYELELDPD